MDEAKDDLDLKTTDGTYTMIVERKLGPEGAWVPLVSCQHTSAPSPSKGNKYAQGFSRTTRRLYLKPGKDGLEKSGVYLGASVLPSEWKKLIKLYLPSDNTKDPEFQSERFHKPRTLDFLAGAMSKTLTPTHKSKAPYLKDGVHQTLVSDFDRGLKELSLRVRYKVGSYPDSPIPSRDTLPGHGVVTYYDPWADSAVTISMDPSNLARSDEQSSPPGISEDNHSEMVMESNKGDLGEVSETDDNDLAGIAELDFGSIEWAHELGAYPNY